MKKYHSFVFLFLCIICVCGCKPSPRFGGAQRRNAAASNTNTLSPQIIEKIQNRYREETGYTIKVIKVHEITTLFENKIFVRIIIERGGKKYLTAVEIENIDGVSVVNILFFMDKEIK